MDRDLERLLDSLLYEGYALYPYTPGATKNATPTPFGIVYPPAYAEHSDATFDTLRMECVLESGPNARVRGSVRFLQAEGERHQGTVRALDLPPTPLAELASSGRGEEFAFTGAEPVQGRVRMRATQLGGGLGRVALCVHNTTSVAGEAAGERTAALRSSLISTHVVLEAEAGRFISPLERKGPVGDAVAACRSVNTWPVLASPGDDAVVGAAIVLPDHPATAPESLGNLFDSTEIEEALLLHVHALSDGERAAIAEQDPAVVEMVERALTTGREDILALHGRLEEVVSEPGHPVPGEPEVTIDGVTYRKGGKVILRPERERDVYDAMLEGRTATIERLYVSSDGEPQIAVTVDGSAEQELFRETGRYLFFRGHEVEPTDLQEARP
ncbi:MAG TPA: hypothetical protein VHJ54_10245 [Solirubrobacterales bacterium]|nr:hypothetical protein [Solirubrobacterales bacterium]